MTTETETLLLGIQAAQLDANELVARLIGVGQIGCVLLLWIATWSLRGKV